VRRKDRALKEIAYWQSRFRLLEKWAIDFDTKSEYKDQCCMGTGKATIYGSSDPKMPKEYIFHELLHIAWSCVRQAKPYAKRRENEEILVQDLSEITFSKKGVDRIKESRYKASNN
jgi:hypothetical protein